MNQDYLNFVKRMGSFDMELDVPDKFLTPQEVQHFGIKGMRWGIRRSEKQLGSRKTKRQMSEDAATVKILKKKRIYEMTNQELQALNQRMNLEQQYKNLKRNASGQKYVTGFVKTFGTDPIKQIIQEQEKAYIKKAIGNFKS